MAKRNQPEKAVTDYDLIRERVDIIVERFHIDEEDQEFLRDLVDKLVGAAVALVKVQKMIEEAKDLL